MTETHSNFPAISDGLTMSEEKYDDKYFDTCYIRYVAGFS